MSLSRVATMAVKAGLWARSFCQQSSIRLWMASGQSMGAGSLKKSFDLIDWFDLISNELWMQWVLWNEFIVTFEFDNEFCNGLQSLN